MKLQQLYVLWDKLGDVPTLGDDLDEPFAQFERGTPMEHVWHWFETQNPRFVVGDVMQGIRMRDEPQQAESDPPVTERDLRPASRG